MTKITTRLVVCKKNAKVSNDLKHLRDNDRAKEFSMECQAP